MHDHSNQFRDLAGRANRGDVGAARELRQQLEPEMARIVRRVLRAPDDNSPLARRIRAAVAGASRTDHAWPTPDPEALIGQVARSLCDRVIGQLRTNRRDGAHMRDTVFN